jgi:hypothetical protein
MVKENKKISSELKDKIISRLQTILHNEFHGEKARIKHGYDRLNCACPYCGDSADNVYKKRGNVYWKTLMYHCYNCGKHTNVINLLDDYKTGLNNVKEVSTVLDFIKENRVEVKSAEYLQIGVFQSLSDLAIDRKEFADTLSLSEIIPNTTAHKFVKGKFLLQRSKHFLYSEKTGQLYILNLTKEDKIIGYQIRNFEKGKAKYVSYTLEKMYSELGKQIPNIDGIEKVNSLSIYFNIMIVDLSRNFTIFEGPTDALLYPKNSLALSGINKNSDMFDQIPTARYFFDNDAIGRRTMEAKLEKKKSVFMWKKFIKDHKLDRRIKDFNDLIRHCYFHKNSAYKNIDKYFTTSPYDILNI